MILLYHTYMLRIYGVDNKKHKCSRLTKIHYMHGTTYVIKIKVMHLIIILYGLIHVATSNSCRNQPSSYGYDLNDVDYMCDVINQFCDGSVCTQKLADLEILYPLNVDPTVACVSGHSEIDVNQGFQPRCSTTSGGGVCIGGPNPCMTNYCTDKYGVYISCRVNQIGHHCRRASSVLRSKEICNSSS